MVDFGESLGLFFVIELTDWLGGILEGGIIHVDDDLGNDSSDFAISTLLCESIVNGLSEPVTDLALAHCDGSFEWHGRGFVGGSLFFVNEDVADLGTITVGDDDFVFAGEGCNECSDGVCDFFLGFGGDFTIFLKGVAAEG